MGEWGRRVYGLVAVALGIVGVAFDDYAEIWEPVPKSVPAHDLLAYASGAILILGGLALNLRRTATAGAITLAAFFGLWVVALKLPPVITAPLSFGPWQAMSEIVAITAGGAFAYALTLDKSSDRAARFALMARLALGACAVIFGLSHFIFLKATVSFIPKYLPHPVFWAYLTGVAHFAGGVALLSGVLSRLAARLLTLMYMVFGALVHAPLVIHDPHSHFGWCANCINGMLIASAWCAYDALGRWPARPLFRTA